MAEKCKLKLIERIFRPKYGDRIALFERSSFKLFDPKPQGQPVFVGMADASWDANGTTFCRVALGGPKYQVYDLGQYAAFGVIDEPVPCYESPKKAKERKFKETEPAGSVYKLSTEFVDMLKKKVPPQSFYTVTFRVDQRDADCITVSGKRLGHPSPDELIKLAILEHYKELSCYDGEWLGSLDSILCFYLDGDFYDTCARFSVDGISISGYDARTGEFYEIPVPSLEQLGIKDLDAAYKYYFRSIGE